MNRRELPGGTLRYEVDMDDPVRREMVEGAIDAVVAEVREQMAADQDQVFEAFADALTSPKEDHNEGA